MTAGNRDEYRENQAKLDNLSYLEKIKARDAIYKKLHDLENFNYDLLDTVSVIEDRKKLFNDLEYLDKIITMSDTHSKNLDEVSSKFETMQNAKILQLKTENLQKIQDVELRKRKYQILKYQNYLNDEATHLLWSLIVVLLVCCFIVLANLLGLPYFTMSMIFALIFTILGIYGIYLIKILLVDNVNINIYDIHQYNYSKPTTEEITRDKSLKDKMLATRSLNAQSQNANGQCVELAPATYTLQGIDSGDGEVKNDMGTQDDSKKCLQLTVS